MLSVHSFRLLLTTEWKRKNGRRNIYMTKSSQKNVPDVGGRYWVDLQQVIADSLASDQLCSHGNLEGSYPVISAH